jgi:hypothetical protein
MTKIPDRHSWKELQSYLNWKGVSWKEAALVGTSAGFLTGVTGVLVFAALRSAGCAGGLW